MSLFDMTGQVGLITGSSRGIGRAIAEQMAEQGARVVISSRKQPACDEVFRKILDNNIVSNHWLIQLVAPSMLERGSGSITIVSSIGGLKGSTVIGAYCISKAADMQLARNLADEFGPRGVRVNCIAPGLIRTDMARALWENADTLKRATSTASLRRIGEPHEIAGAVVFLASKAGAFVNGQTIVVDGGVTTSGGMA